MEALLCFDHPSGSPIKTHRNRLFIRSMEDKIDIESSFHCYAQFHSTTLFGKVKFLIAMFRFFLPIRVFLSHFLFEVMFFPFHFLIVFQYQSFHFSVGIFHALMKPLQFILGLLCNFLTCSCCFYSSIGDFPVLMTLPSFIADPTQKTRN